jgi:hypothetical protein
MHNDARMRTRALIVALGVTIAASIHARTDELAAAANVNSRYTVESIAVEPLGITRLSPVLRDRNQSLVGAPFDQQLLDDVGSRIGQELRNWAVQMTVARGATPEYVRVTFEVSRKEKEVDLTVPRFVYHSRQGFSFGVDTGFRTGGNTFRAGILTDNDQLVERYSGIRGGYERAISSRVSAGIHVGSFRSQWAPSTESSLDASVPGIYRTRAFAQPFTNIAIFRSLTLQLGVSAERLQMQYPAARHELSSAANLSLRFQRRWELTSGRHADLNASYGMHAASRALGSDFVYNRHQWDARGAFQDGHHQLIASLGAGRLTGQAPLFERFVIGNSTTLRGWNRFDIVPFGASRMMHGSLEYRYRWLRTIYDTGAAWNRGGPARVRHSAAIGVSTSGTMQISALIAFPIRDGGIEPMFITGLYF